MPVPRHYLAFMAWHEENRDRFAVPVRPLKRRFGWMHLAFATIDPAILRVAYNARNLSVTVHGPPGDGRPSWDMLLSLDVEAIRVAGGWGCRFCRASPQIGMVPVFPNREALYVNHLFEPFLTFVNAELATASALALWADNGISWASLVNADPADEEKPTYFVPLSVPPCRRHQA